MGFWDTAAKNVPRQYVMQQRKVRGRRRAVKNALLLPGYELLCAHAGRQSGLLDSSTRLVFAEKYPDVQRQIVRRWPELQTEHEPRLHRGLIENLALRSALQNQPLEFAFLDLCSALNPTVASWIITELGPAIGDGATIAFTLMRCWRSSRYMRWWTDLLADGDSEVRKIWNRADEQIREAECTGIVGATDAFYDDASVQSADTFTVKRPKEPWCEFIRPEYRDTSVDALSALHVLFPYHAYTLDACIEYRRTSNPGSAAMTTFVLTGFKRLQKPVISQSLLKLVAVNVSPQLQLPLA